MTHPTPLSTPLSSLALLTEDEAAAVLNVSVKAMQKWRTRGNGPKFIRMFKAVRYTREDLLAYIDESRCSITSGKRSRKPQPDDGDAEEADSLALGLSPWPQDQAA